MSHTYLQIIADYQIESGAEQTVLEALAHLAADSRQEPGNLSYEFFRDVEDPLHVVVLERYTDDEAFAAHRASPHFATIATEQIIPHLTERVVRTFSSR
ncbi:putative quinol monooxygenase [Streptomyces hygroscopicus]|uniref:putative quinol monooxygenase n=1 Tax=Streptomyces hygroscopicus TaxID=1912 RepID=UPI00076719D2|nr:putative quinol monooxygenase [Streptomyces hygroscopicus]GLV76109.1 hypothetical protein Shyhy02_41090 [Streptomyces hygroscopicus subsp. hygroscopicus]